MKLKKAKAVALRYKDSSDTAPKVIAKGEGTIAEQIKEVAKESGVPLYEDDALVEILAQIELDREIPPELFKAVAEVLAWVYKTNNSI